MRKGRPYLIYLYLCLGLGFLTLLAPGRGLLNEAEFFPVFQKLPFLGFSKAMDFLGSWRFILPMVLVVSLIGALKDDRKLIKGIVMTALGSFVLNGIIKLFFHRLRPTGFALAVENTYSYPSGHAMVSTSIYLFICYYIKLRYDKNIYPLGIILSLLMGLSRVYLGVHYISDIIGGFLGGYFFYRLVKDMLGKSVDKR